MSAPLPGYRHSWQRWLGLFNLLLAILFAVFFLWTFVARDHLESLAHEFVLTKTEQYAAPLVEAAAELLKHPLAKQWVLPQWRQMIKQQIADYHQNPRVYLEDLIRKAKAVPPAERGQKLLEWKQNVRNYYETTLNNLVRDLRIFAGSNLVAAMIAVLLCWLPRKEHPPNVIPLSVLLTLGILYCGWMYIDSFSFFDILFNTYLGWSYPVILAGGVVLVWQQGKRSTSLRES